MKIEAKLKRTPSCKIDPQQSIPNFPVPWNLQCLTYGSLKLHVKEFKIRKQISEDENGEPPNEIEAWEHSFSVRLTEEVKKVNTFYEERHNECLAGLKSIGTEIPLICTIKSIHATQIWHEFILFYTNKVKPLEAHQETPAQFLVALEGQILKIMEKATDAALPSILKRLLVIHKQALQLKSFAQFNIIGIKKLLQKHDKRAKISISTEWMDRIYHESFGTYSSFEKTVALTKDLTRSLVPSLDDYSCAICLGIMCEPVVIRCGHRFCEHCLIVVSSTCSFCPLCRTEQPLHPNNHTPDKPLKLYLKHYFPGEYKSTQREHKRTTRRKGCAIS